MIAACCVCISFVRRQKQMFYLDDHNPNSTQIESEHERQQCRISAAEANAFAVDNRPPTPFSGLSKYQSGWLIKGFAKAGVELDERKKEMAESMLKNMFGEVSDAALSFVHFCFASTVRPRESRETKWSSHVNTQRFHHLPFVVRPQKEPAEEVDESEIIARVLRKNKTVTPPLSDGAILQQIKSMDMA